METILNNPEYFFLNFLAPKYILYNLETIYLPNVTTFY